MRHINGFDKNGIQRVLVRMAHEILERNDDTSQLAVIGIQTRGACLAKRLRKNLEDLSLNKEIPLGILDITLYRDDLAEVAGGHPQVKATKIAFDVTKKDIILVDDVLFTGRTIRAALDAIIDYGRPRVIQLAVLVDRGHRQLPIKADFIGKNIPTSFHQKIHLKLEEIDGEDQLLITDHRNEDRSS